MIGPGSTSVAQLLREGERTSFLRHLDAYAKVHGDVIGLTAKRLIASRLTGLPSGELPRYCLVGGPYSHNLPLSIHLLLGNAPVALISSIDAVTAECKIFVSQGCGHGHGELAERGEDESEVE